MRIGLLIYGSLDTLSGGYLYDRKLVEYFRDAGDDVEIISLPWRSYPRHLLDKFSRDLSRRLRAMSADVLIQDDVNDGRQLCVFGRHTVELDAESGAPGR